jgi:hypothetical protein
MMEVYQLHVWLCEISPLIWRRLLVRRETGCHGGPVPSRGVLKELPVGRERPDQRPQGGQVAGEHQGPHQAAEPSIRTTWDAVSCVATVPATRLPTGAVPRKTRLYKLRMRPRFSSSTIVWRIGNSNGICAPPCTPRRKRRSGLQPGRARCSATVAGAGQAAQDGGGERRRGALGGQPRDGRRRTAGGGHITTTETFLLRFLNASNKRSRCPWCVVGLKPAT